MERLTSNRDVSEMGMVELAHNSCYVKDHAAWYRNYSMDIDARALARKLLVDFAEGDDAFTCAEDFDEYMAACLEDGTESIEGLIALFYRNLWAMADLHARLKRLEDLADQGRLMELPCAVGDTVLLSNGTILPVIYITSTASGIEVGLQNGIRISNTTYRAAGYYRTRKAAREALERMVDGNETD